MNQPFLSDRTASGLYYNRRHFLINSGRSVLAASVLGQFAACASQAQSGHDPAPALGDTTPVQLPSIKHPTENPTTRHQHRRTNQNALVMHWWDWGILRWSNYFPHLGNASIQNLWRL